MSKDKIKEYPPFSLNIPRMGYVLAYKNDGGFFSKQISKVQLKKGFTKEQAQVTHIEVSGGGPDSVFATPPKSRAIKITKTHSGRYVYILRYKNDDYQNRGRYKIAYFSGRLCNLDYDIRGVMKFVRWFKWMNHSTKRFFCSEGALYSFRKQYDTVMQGLKPCNCMPAHFMSSDQFEIVWQGVITKEVS